MVSELLLKRTKVINGECSIVVFPGDSIFLSRIISKINLPHTIVFLVQNKKLPILSSFIGFPTIYD